MGVRNPDIAYREAAPPRGLHGHVTRRWALRALADGEHRVLPDGWMDLLHTEGRPAMLAGSDTESFRVPRTTGTTTVGLRLAPGAAAALLGRPAAELRDQRVAVVELWGDTARRLEESLAGARSPEERIRALEAAVLELLPAAGPLDRVVAAAAARLRLRPATGVGELGGGLGLSERQLRRRFHAAVGYGPKLFARVARFQRLLALADRRPPARGDLAGLALEAGYADQAHMTAECARLAALPPARLLGAERRE
jgi:methylphosphotriester-DNA--protein-cysteine methyltransferase